MCCGGRSRHWPGRGTRARGDGRDVRWSKERGSVYLGDQKLPIVYQRVRDQIRDVEVPLETYQRLQQPRALDHGLLRRVLLGLSCRRYAECAEAVPEAFGLAPSTVSRRYISRKFPPRRAPGLSGSP